MLVHRKAPVDPDTAQVTLALPGTMRLLAAATGDLTGPGLDITGDAAVLQQLIGVLDRPDPAFNIVTP